MSAGKIAWKTTVLHDHPRELVRTGDVLAVVPTLPVRPRDGTLMPILNPRTGGLVGYGMSDLQIVRAIALPPAGLACISWRKARRRDQLGPQDLLVFPDMRADTTPQDVRVHEGKLVGLHVDPLGRLHSHGDGTLIRWAAS